MLPKHQRQVLNLECREIVALWRARLQVWFHDLILSCSQSALWGPLILFSMLPICLMCLTYLLDQNVWLRCGYSRSGVAFIGSLEPFPHAQTGISVLTLPRSGTFASISENLVLTRTCSNRTMAQSHTAVDPAGDPLGGDMPGDVEDADVDIKKEVKSESLLQLLRS